MTHPLKEPQAPAYQSPKGLGIPCERYRTGTSAVFERFVALASGMGPSISSTLSLAVGGQPGKEETFRCRWGKVYLYVPGKPATGPASKPPVGSESYYTVWNEVCLKPGDQYTLTPDTPHWFQAGPEGAIVSEFSTRSTDENDVFTDTRIARLPVVE